MPRVVGIDLGTTNSLVAAVIDGRPVILRDAQGRGIVPSVVSGRDRGLLVGEQARAEAPAHPEDTIFSIKRFMGRDRDDVKELLGKLPFKTMTAGRQLRFRAASHWLTPPQVSAEILKALKRQAEDALGALVEQAVITVPAYFNDGQRQATRDAGQLAGLQVLRILNEPTAACLAYGLQEKQEGTFAVYDLGGGTFDISILRVENGVFEVLATNGNTELGGDDFDRLIGEKVLAQAEAGRAEPFERTPRFLAILRQAAEEAKMALTGAPETSLRLEDDGAVLLERTITRDELEEWIRPFVARTLESCRQALEDADLLPEEIDEVVMVGGSTRVPLVRRMVGEYFECDPHIDLDPDEVVALGAAVQGDILAGNRRDLLLLDVTPLSLGIETYGGAFARMIPRNSTVPCSVTELYTTFVDNQTHVDVHVLQGEHEIAERNRSLARFKLGPLDPLPAGFARVEVTFTIDADGILKVSARDQRTGREQAVDVKPTYGMSEADLEAMLKAGADSSHEEKEQRLLIEERNHAELTIRATEKALDEAGELIDEIDLIVIEEQLAKLREAVQGSDYKELRAARDRLEGATRPLAVAAMNAALARNLQGKSAKDVLGADGDAEILTPEKVNPDHQQTISVQLEIGKKKEE